MLSSQKFTGNTGTDTEPVEVVNTKFTPSETKQPRTFTIVVWKKTFTKFFACGTEINLSGNH